MKRESKANINMFNGINLLVDPLKVQNELISTQNWFSYNKGSVEVKKGAKFINSDAELTYTYDNPDYIISSSGTRLFLSDVPMKQQTTEVTVVNDTTKNRKIRPFSNIGIKSIVETHIKGNNIYMVCDTYNLSPYLTGSETLTGSEIVGGDFDLNDVVNFAIYWKGASGWIVAKNTLASDITITTAGNGVRLTFDEIPSAAQYGLIVRVNLNGDTDLYPIAVVMHGETTIDILDSTPIDAPTLTTLSKTRYKAFEELANTTGRTALYVMNRTLPHPIQVPLQEDDTGNDLLLLTSYMPLIDNIDESVRHSNNDTLSYEGTQNDFNFLQINNQLILPTVNNVYISAIVPTNPWGSEHVYETTMYGLWFKEATDQRTEYDGFTVDSSLIVPATAVIRASDETYTALTAVLNELDFTTNEPARTNGHRYLNIGTGIGSATGQAVTANYIYQGDGTNWVETVPVELNSVANSGSGITKVYKSGSWLNIANLAGEYGPPPATKAVYIYDRIVASGNPFQPAALYHSDRLFGGMLGVAGVNFFVGYIDRVFGLNSEKIYDLATYTRTSDGVDVTAALAIFTSTGIEMQTADWQDDGSGEPGQVKRLSAYTGIVEYGCNINSPYGLIFLGEDNLYQFTPNGDPEKIGVKVSSLLDRNINKSKIIDYISTIITEFPQVPYNTRRIVYDDGIVKIRTKQERIAPKLENNLDTLGTSEQIEALCLYNLYYDLTLNGYLYYKFIDNGGMAELTIYNSTTEHTDNEIAFGTISTASSIMFMEERNNSGVFGYAKINYDSDIAFATTNMITPAKLISYEVWLDLRLRDQPTFWGEHKIETIDSSGFYIESDDLLALSATDVKAKLLPMSGYDVTENFPIYDSETSVAYEAKNLVSAIGSFLCVYKNGHKHLTYPITSSLTTSELHMGSLDNIKILKGMGVTVQIEDEEDSTLMYQFFGNLDPSELETSWHEYDLTENTYDYNHLYFTGQRNFNTGRLSILHNNSGVNIKLLNMDIFFKTRKRGRLV